jgi:site-specific DNA-methyltransferase (adenine-specific)
VPTVLRPAPHTLVEKHSNQRNPRRWQVKHADCLQALPKLDTASVDVVITDPPYGIAFNDMAWDRPATLDPGRPSGRRRAPSNLDAFRAFCEQWARGCLHVMKPGAHLAAFASPRTAHMLACGLEAAGLELRDTLMWIQGQGFPAAQPQSDGRASRLKPAYEPILLARKPLDGSLTQNLSRYGTGAMNIDACRISDATARCPGEGRAHGRTADIRGRWPANLLLSHAGTCTSGGCDRDCPIALLGARHRFFYCAKARRPEREAGCERLPRRTIQTLKVGAANEQRARTFPVANIHPTVKPIELMRWLVRLISPADGLVLDPFTGSGSTGAAAVLEGRRFLGIEREADYVPIARARIAHWARLAGRDN